MTAIMGRKRREADLKTYSGRVAARLRTLREEKGWDVPETIKRLRRAGLEVEAPTYYGWESGKRDIALEHVPALASIFGKTVRAFLPAE
jgi:transcriptional regulator with XRE-family HTH domain